MQPMSPHAMVPAGPAHLSAGLNSPQLKIKRPWLSFLGNKYWVYAPDGSLVAFVKMPLFRMRHELIVYGDEAMTQPLMQLRAQKVLSLKPTYTVTDVASGTMLGQLRHLPLSLFRDKWEVLDPQGQQIGSMTETGSALLRRLIPLLLGEWSLVIGADQSAPAVHIKQVFRFFMKEYDVDLSQAAGRIDPRFAVACAVFAIIKETVREAS